MRAMLEWPGEAGGGAATSSGVIPAKAGTIAISQ
jgi:hypothetical protein